MLNELNKQVQDRGLPAEVANWLAKRYPEGQEIMSLTEGEHILDWIEVKKPPKLAKMTWEEALRSADKWSKAEQKKGANIKESDFDTELFMEVGEFRIVRLVGEAAFKREGHLMRHCVASYFGKTGVKIYSLRDSKNEPHCTIEVVGDNQIQQVKGKGNGEIHPNYIDAVIQLLEKLGMYVRDSEMANLGYVNIEKIKKDLHNDTIKGLVRKNYWNKKDKLLAKDGTEYQSLDLLDVVPLISEDSKTGLKINFELEKFIKLSFEFLWNKTKKVKKTQGYSSNSATQGYSSNSAAQGNYSNSAAQGSYSNSAAQGDYSKSATQGYSSKSAAQGDSSNSAAQGNSSNSAAQGNYSNSAAQGDSSNSAAQGNSSNSAAQGNSSKSAAQGNYSNSAAQGDYSKSEVIGKEAIATAMGLNAKARGSIGSWIVLSEFQEINNKWAVVAIKSAKIDGITMKENVWYWLKGGEFIEVNN